MEHIQSLIAGSVFGGVVLSAVLVASGTRTKKQRRRTAKLMVYWCLFCLFMVWINLALPNGAWLEAIQ